MLIKKILSSLLIGGSIGTAPYLLATSLPSPAVIPAKNENVGFGERCLLEREICDFMKETKFVPDQEDLTKEENQYLTPYLRSKLEQEWKDFIRNRPDDYCGFGFFEPKTPADLQKVKEKKINVNNFEACYQFLVDKQKEAQTKTQQ